MYGYKRQYVREVKQSNKINIFPIFYVTCKNMYGVISITNFYT